MTISTYSRSKSHRLYTLVVPVDLKKKRILLGYKKRGFGEGKYNGFGGKVEPGETIPAAAARELEEESGISVKETELTQQGILLLETVADPAAQVLEIHLFTLTEWTGQEVETEEMAPAWFEADSSSTTGKQVPYSQMWEESARWMPDLLKIIFDEQQERRGKYFIHHVEFVGGEDPATKKYCVWHGMGKSRIEFRDSVPEFPEAQ